ncbi:MAG TPA: hypothetical protein VGF84_15885 [Micromonosporaceae bacterium]
MRDDSRRPMSLILTAAVAVIVLTVAGCAKAPAEEGSLGGQDAQPAKLIAVPGSSLHKVVLTPAAVKQVGIETTPVAQMPANVPTAASTAIASGGTATAAKMTEIPVTAVIYDPQGASWTYTIPAERTYLRVPIVVDRVDGDTAYLSSGPPVGTPVVSQGAPELLGAEYGVGEE